MTELLSELLRSEASQIEIPLPVPTEILAQGKAMRRRRSVTATLASVAVAAILVTGVALMGPFGDRGSDGTRKVDPASPADLGAVFSIGTTVYINSGESQAEVDDVAIKSLYYTSAGVVVRHGDNPYSDGGGPQRFSLVTPDGTVRKLSVTLEETVTSTDPTQPYLAWAEVIDDTVNVVVLDVSNDKEVARVPVEGDFGWGGWAAPPVSISGGFVYVGTDGAHQRVVDWREGNVEPGEADSFPQVNGGRRISADGRTITVIDVASGQPVVTASLARDSFGRLSPNGSYLQIDTHPTESGQDSTARFYNLDAVDPLDQVAIITVGSSDDYVPEGWSTGEQVIFLRGQRLQVCDPDTGSCETSRIELPAEPDPNDPGAEFAREVKMGGIVYES
jgi:hypothetical protein